MLCKIKVDKYKPILEDIQLTPVLSKIIDKYFIPDSIYFNSGSIVINNKSDVSYIVKKDKFEEFFPNDLCCKYIDREFLIGKSDCLTLISDYYKEELGITLSEYPRDEKWDKNYNEFIQLKLKKISGNKFEDFLENENLIKIENISFAKKHDIIVFKYLDNYPSHFGIYLDHGYILHQPRNKKSTIEKLTNAEKRRIYCFLRHKELC